jgi:LysM repeat protein
MKLIHVTGLVIAVHAAVFVVIFATPGCRSTGRPKPTPEDTAPASVSPVVDTIKPLPASNDGELSASNAAAVTPVAPVGTSNSAQVPFADTTVRFAPSRPAPAPLVDSAPAPAPSATHTVVKGDNLWSIARKYGISLDELAAANQLAKTASLRLGQTLAVPAKAAAPAVATGGEAANTYAVVSGDTLGSIARKHGTTAAALRTANNLKGDALRIGQKLVIPGNALPVSNEVATSSVKSDSTASARPAPRAGEGTHTVAPGDTLGSIARKHGVRVGDLATLNNITDPAKIRVGLSLKLPAGARTVSSAANVSVATPAAPVEAASPAPTPVTPVQPMAVPVIRID